MLEVVDGDEFDPGALPRGRVPVLFTADWCGPCRMLKPHFASRAEGVADLFVQVDVSDEESPAWDAHAIEVVPTLVIFRDGAPVYREGGFLQARDLDRILAAT